MFKGTYEFAKITVEINSIYAYIHDMSKNYVTQNPPSYVITITEEDILFEKERDKDINPTIYPDAYLETLAVYRKFLNLAYQENVFLFHSSSFSIDGNGFILTAPSGTGKSTHAVFLKEVYQDSFLTINDDKPLVRYENDEFILYGSPWNGKHGLDQNTSAPLKAIFVLYQANENKIEALSATDALTHLFKQIYKPLFKDASKKILELMICLSNRVPIYYFGCTNSILSTNVSCEIINQIKSK